MSHPELVECDDRLEVRSPMRPGMRVLLAALALFPLIAPYELLIKTEWEYYFHPFFFLAAAVSAGAVWLSVFLLFAAIAGLSARMVFVASCATFTYSDKTLLTRWTERTFPLGDIRSVEVGVREWSDGAPTYHLRVIMNDGTRLECGSSWSRDEIESIRDSVTQFIAAVDASGAAF